MTNDLIARAEAAIKEPNNWVGRALVRELLAALKAARAENERLRHQLRDATVNTYD